MNESLAPQLKWKRVAATGGRGMEGELDHSGGATMGTGRREGVGMGLAMVRRIVERHGGRVWVEPTPGGGATFKVRLPAG